MSDISQGASELLDNISKTVESSGIDTYHIPSLPNIDSDSVPFELWEAIAYDFALGVYEPSQIAEGYDLEEYSVLELLNNDKFNKILETKKSEVASLGDGADFTVKMRMIVNKAAPHLMRRLLSSSTEDRDFLRLFGMATELAQLRPKEEKDGEEAPVIPGAGININLYGMPGLEHLSKDNDYNSSKVIDVSDNKETAEPNNVGEEVLRCL